MLFERAHPFDEGGVGRQQSGAVGTGELDRPTVARYRIVVQVLGGQGEAESGPGREDRRQRRGHEIVDGGGADSDVLDDRKRFRHGVGDGEGLSAALE